MARVTVHEGTLIGREIAGIHSFKGIPYADTISGENRWLPPQPPKAWEGQRDATKFGNICPQLKFPTWWLSRAGRLYLNFAMGIDANELQGDDCLNLNVWTPSLDPQAKLPVMYWIHGGGFIFGSGSMSLYDGTKLAQKGVVVVTINYRLGFMGCFSAPHLFEGDFCAPNRGILDQIEGLRWVNENIERFGGDPGNITIFGNSAGGSSVSALMATPLSHGLFHRAILQSGAPDLGVPLSEYQLFAADFLKEIGIEKGDQASFAKFTAKDTIRLSKIANKLISHDSEKKYGHELRKMKVFTPNIFGTDSLPMSNIESVEKGQAKGIDLMIGSVLDEGRQFTLIAPGPPSLASWLSLHLYKAFLNPDDDLKQVMQRYKNNMPDLTNHTIREQILNDVIICRGTVRFAEAHSVSDPGRTFYYRFDWTSPAMNGRFGAVHGIEIPFITQNLDSASFLLGKIDESLRELSNTVSDAWVTFAKTGTPSAPNLPEWEAFNTEERACMVLNTQSEMRYDIEGSRKEIW